MTKNRELSADAMSEEAGTSRRTLLRRTLVVLGAGVLLQPNGGDVAWGKDEKKSSKPFKNRHKGAGGKKTTTTSGPTPEGTTPPAKLQSTTPPAKLQDTPTESLKQQ
jgi:hypothetical protein